MKKKDTSKGPIENFAEQKHAEIELIKAKEKAVIGEKYLDNIINNIGDPIFVKDENSILTLVNDAFCTLFEKERDDIIGKTLAEDVAPDEMEDFLKIDKQVLKTGEENINEESLTVKGKPTRTISTRKSRYINPNNKKYLIGVIRDITQRKIAEEQLKESLSQNELAVNITKLGLWQLNVDSGELLWNDRHLEFYGITREEFNNDLEGWRNQIHPDDKKYADSRFQEVFERKSIHDVNFRIIRPNGDIRYLSASAAPIVIDGKLVKVIGVNQDITKSKESEKELKESEVKFRALFEESPFGILLCEAVRDEKGTLINYIHVKGNKSVKTQLGIEEKDVIGKTALEINDSKQAKDLIVELDSMLLTKKSFDYTQYFSVINKTLQVTAFPLNSDQFILNFIDVTEKKQAEKELKESEERIRIFTQNVPDFLLQIDRTGKINYINKTLEGLTQKDVIGSSVYSWIPEESSEMFKDKVEKVFKDGGSEVIEYPGNGLKGEPIWFESKIGPLEKSGIITQVIIVSRDVTERKEAKDALKESEERFELAMAATKDSLFDFNLVTNEIYYSPAFKSKLGYKEEELANDVATWEKVTRPEDVEASWTMQQEVINKQRDRFEIEVKMQHKNGHWIDILTRADILFDDKGKAIRMVGTNVDITERKKAELDLKRVLKENIELKQQIEAENVYLKEELKLDGSFNEIVGSSKGLKKTLKQVVRVAKTDTTVLILGETGTGKELIARAIHNASDRKDKPMVKVNCSALPAELVESEFFGHEIGAFTGAVKRKIGRFELANGGTIFLDEIGDLPLGLQTRLLRVLQESEFERVGGEVTIKVDVRVITATNRNLKEEIVNGNFRQDLYYRLNVFPITCSALRDRIDDIPILVNHFVNKYNHKVNKKIKTVNQKSLDRLMKYKWPGNVRELEHIIERAVILNEGGQLQLGNWFMDSNLDNAVSDGLTTLEIVERDYIIKVLEKSNWKIRGKNGAAEILGMQPTTLESRMKKRDIRR